MLHGVETWFEQRTSVSDQWCRYQLAEEKSGSRVSVVLPARDEEATVGAIVSTLRRELVETVPLIDEIVVVDSWSVDRTAQEARDAGARVVQQAQVLPEVGDLPGKGEALWKSLFVTEGDIVVFVDADLRDFDEQFVVGLLGPLLTDSRTRFVKAFYDRTLHTGEQVLPAGGGRVTELVARPLLNLYWPALAGFVQPLAGEYAGRRSLLERVPFLSGYGVEIGMLIDIVEEAGLGAMAQVDLGRRDHRNSSDAALGRMAAQLQLAMLARLHRYGRALLTTEPEMTLTQFARHGASFLAETHEVRITERPAMVNVPAYRERRVLEHP
ncbi:glucosyl-3-phosphoglycerate synthase [Cellulosimicrobium cellulans]|uniref:glucosyl-3-phosphoglycerate synthase n=1 Tax=Cellulosimicrobium cellulans TaxID=1710 RepID=UPI000848A398|nr:glucosyl-3-phosphoglycerate synthase [Cellulosimicrobium cellulans]